MKYEKIKCGMKVKWAQSRNVMATGIVISYDAKVPELREALAPIFGRSSRVPTRLMATVKSGDKTVNVPISKLRKDEE